MPPVTPPTVEQAELAPMGLRLASLQSRASRGFDTDDHPGLGGASDVVVGDELTPEQRAELRDRLSRIG